MSEGLVNVYSISSQIRRALKAMDPAAQLWRGPNARLFSANPEKARKIFLETDAFIITTGLSELRCDETGGGRIARPDVHTPMRRPRWRRISSNFI